MATEPTPKPTEIPGGPSVSPADPTQGKAVNDAFKGIDLTTASEAPTPSTAPAGTKLFQDASGKTFAVVDAGAAGGKKLKLKDLQALLPAGSPVVLDGDGLGKVKGGKGSSDDNVVSTSNDDMTFALGDGNDKAVATGFGDNTFDMGDGDDAATGGAGDDTIDGGAGNDTLSGSAGSDSITGGGGDDVIEGGRGNDKLAGGGGHDTFVFGNQPTGSDVVSGFSADDVLKIADRNGDHHLTADATNPDGTVANGDYYLASNDQGDAIIWLRNENGVVDGKIKLKGVNVDDIKAIDNGDDGTFTI